MTLTNERLRQAALDFAIRSSVPQESTTVVLSRADAYFGFLTQSDPRLDQMMDAFKRILAIADSESRSPHTEMAQIAERTINTIKQEVAISLKAGVAS
jgi:hypothetical protein